MVVLETRSDLRVNQRMVTAMVRGGKLSSEEDAGCNGR